MPSFTDLSVRSLPEGMHFDSKLPSFGIRIGKRRRTWLVVKQPNRTKVRLGFYPELSLQAARRQAMIALGTPHRPISAPPFPEALKAFLAEARWRPRSHAVLKSSLGHFSWTRPLDKITHEDIAQALAAIPHKSARAHALKDIRTFFNWCVPRYLPSSPCVGFKMPAQKPRQRLLTDDEIVRVWRAAEDMGVYGTQIQCAITTGQRIGQIVAFDPSWAQDDKIVFPAAVMKGGREHVIPLCPLSASLLPSLRKTTYQGKRKHELDHLSGVSDWVIHDIRRYFSSTHARVLKTPIDCTEALLSHRSGSRSEVQRIYDLYDRMDEMRTALEGWERHLSKLLT